MTLLLAFMRSSLICNKILFHELHEILSMQNLPCIKSNILQLLTSLTYFTTHVLLFCDFAIKILS